MNSHQGVSGRKWLKMSLASFSHIYVSYGGFKLKQRDVFSATLSGLAQAREGGVSDLSSFVGSLTL